jgi:hypothetical protein
MYLLNNDLSVVKLLDKKSAAISFVTEIELLGWPHITSSEINTIKTFISNCYYYDYSQAIKNNCIELRKGYKLKLADALIVATAIEFDLTLISADKGLAKVKELQIINFIPSLHE